MMLYESEERPTLSVDTILNASKHGKSGRL